MRNGEKSKVSDREWEWLTTPVFKLAARSNLSYKEMLSELERIGHAVDVDGYRTHARVLHNIGISLMNELLEMKNAPHE